LETAADTKAEDWAYGRFPEALLQTEHNSGEAHGGGDRIKVARLPARQTCGEIDVSFQRSIESTPIRHVGQLELPRQGQRPILPSTSTISARESGARGQNQGWSDNRGKAFNASACWKKPPSSTTQRELI
jgi:hypothetical protein